MNVRFPFQIKEQMNLPRSQHPKVCIWRPEQRVKFAVFVDCFSEQLRTCFFSSGKRWAFWRKLSIFIQTKNPNQCRIFHRKLLHSFSTVRSITSHLKKNIDMVEQLYSFYQNMLSNTFRALNSQNSREITIQQPVEDHIVKIKQTKLQPQADSTKQYDHKERNGSQNKEQFYIGKKCQSKDKFDCTYLHSKHELEPIRLNNSIQTMTHLSDSQCNGYQKMLVYQAIECHRNFLQYIDFLKQLPNHIDGSS